MTRRSLIFLYPCLFFLLMMVLCFSSAFAEGVRFRSDLTYTNSNTTLDNKSTGQKSSSEFSLTEQQYNLDFSKRIYPYLNISGGSIYELNSFTSTQQSTKTHGDEKILRPFAEISLDNPEYKAGFGYRKTQIENSFTDIKTTTDTRDEYNTILGWHPAALPEIDLRYNHTHTYDDPETVDRIEKKLDVDTRYTIGQDLRISYLYTRIDRANDISGSGTLENNHNGTIDYSHSFLNNRLAMSTGYRIRQNTLESDALETADVPLLRSAGLALIDVSPEDESLDPNPELIDGNTSASAGLNIGLSGDETELTAIGIDFGFPVSVEKLHVWVDRHLPLSISSAYSWSIYTSPDNNPGATWTLLTTLSSVAFGTLDNRFEIAVPKTTARFFMVTVRPLSPAIADAAVFPDIFITEMQAFATSSGLTGNDKLTRVNHNYNLNLGYRLSDLTSFGCNMFYDVLEQDPFSDKRTELTSGIYYNHMFNRIFSSSTNVSRTERKEADDQSPSEKEIDYNYSSSLRASYLETLKQVLSFSGSKLKQDDGSSDRNAFYLRTNALLYKGFSAFFDTGYSWETPLNQAGKVSTIVRTGANLIPNRKITVNLDYSETQTKDDDPEKGRTTESSWRMQTLIAPYRALTFNIDISVREDENSKHTLQNYSVNWAPFPDGNLQLFFSYVETLRPEDGQKDKSLGPSLKWKLSSNLVLDMSYNTSEIENRLQTIASDTFRTNLRLIF